MERSSLNLHTFMHTHEKTQAYLSLRKPLIQKKLSTDSSPYQIDDNTSLSSETDVEQQSTIINDVGLCDAIDSNLEIDSKFFTSSTQLDDIDIYSVNSIGFSHKQLPKGSSKSKATIKNQSKNVKHRYNLRGQKVKQLHQKCKETASSIMQRNNLALTSS